MKMVASVHVWKLGNHYDSREDMNGGKAEYSYIYNAIEDACRGIAVFKTSMIPGVEEYTNKVISFVINGNFAPRDIDRIKAARAFSDILVYVFTDFSLASKNKMIIETCDFILHQSPIKDSRLFGVPGIYSYIPELFYEESFPVSKVKMDVCFFGGKEDGRENEFDEYILTERGEHAKQDFKEKMFALYKNRYDEDFRVRYADYRKILSLFKYSFVSGRIPGSDVGWVTPRLVEAVNAGCIPILINQYDSLNHFGFGRYRVSSYNELRQFMDEAPSMDTTYEMTRAAQRFIAGRKIFKGIVQNIIETCEPLHRGKSMI